jgi:hypothetical protein
MSTRLFTPNTMAQRTQLGGHTCTESGSVAVEAAVGIPFFLAIMFTSIQLLLFCFQLLSFQYQVATLTTNVFLNPNGDWTTAIKDGVATIGNGLGLCPGNTSDCHGESPTWEGEDVVTITYLCSASTSTCDATTAQSGDLARVTVTFTKPIFKVVEDVGMEPLTLSVSAISGIMRAES